MKNLKMTLAVILSTTMILLGNVGCKIGFSYSEDKNEELQTQPIQTPTQSPTPKLTPVLEPVPALLDEVSGEGIATKEMIKDALKRIPIFILHHVIDKPIPGGPNSYLYISDEKFEKLLETLEVRGYKTIFISELYERLINNETNEKLCVITIDDGWSNNYEYAFPILKEYEEKATINIIAGKVPEVSSKEGYFSWDEANEMEDSGLIELQNHTYSHKNAKELSDEEIKYQLLEAQELIDKNLGLRDIKAYIASYGELTESSMEIARELGFYMQVGVNNDMSKYEKDDVIYITRTLIKESTNIGKILDKYDAYYENVTLD